MGGTVNRIFTIALLLAVFSLLIPGYAIPSVSATHPDIPGDDGTITTCLIDACIVQALESLLSCTADPGTAQSACDTNFLDDSADCNNHQNNQIFTDPQAINNCITPPVTEPDFCVPECERQVEEEFQVCFDSFIAVGLPPFLAEILCAPARDADNVACDNEIPAGAFFCPDFFFTPNACTFDVGTCGAEGCLAASKPIGTDTGLGSFCSASVCTGDAGTCGDSTEACLQVPTNCDDGNVCTTNVCDGQAEQCVAVPIAEGASCGDDNICDGAGACVNPATEVDIDHYLGYDIKETKETPEFEDIQVVLTDQFGTGVFEVKKPDRLYNPVDKNEEGIIDEITHLVGYEIEAVDDEHDDIIAIVNVTNQFGDIILDVEEEELLLVPSSKTLGSPPEPFDSTLSNHYKCYEVEVTDDTPEFEKRLVSVIDPNFGEERLLEVEEPELLCNPVEKMHNGVLAEIIDPENHLLCYKVTPADGDQEHQKRNDVFTHNQFGFEQFETDKERQLCVPSMKMVLETPPDDDDDDDDE